LPNTQVFYKSNAHSDPTGNVYTIIYHFQFTKKTVNYVIILLLLKTYFGKLSSDSKGKYNSIIFKATKLFLQTILPQHNVQARTCTKTNEN